MLEPLFAKETKQEGDTQARPLKRQDSLIALYKNVYELKHYTVFKRAAFVVSGAKFYGVSQVQATIFDIKVM